MADPTPTGTDALLVAACWTSHRKRLPRAPMLFTSP